MNKRMEKAAKRAGVSLDEYLLRRGYGERFCIGCNAWHRQDVNGSVMFRTSRCGGKKTTKSGKLRFMVMKSDPEQELDQIVERKPTLQEARDRACELNQLAKKVKGPLYYIEESWS